MSTEPSQSIGTGDDLFDLEEDVTQSSSRKRRLTSKVWNDFDRKNGLNGYTATCKHCKKDFVAGSSKGTSHLKSHLAKHYPVLLAKGTNTPKGASESTPKATNFVFDQESSRLDLAKMVIKHNYPFNMAEHEFFEIFLNGLQPMFKLPSRNTIRADVLYVYQIEKAKLYKLLDELSCRITLTTDIWTSDHQNLAYACLTAHYITDDWKLKKKILSYKCIVYPHDGETLFEFIKELILEWNIDNKLVSMVVDNAGANDVMVRLLKRWLHEKSLLLSSGKFFHVRCSAHILNLIVQDGLKEIVGLISKIRESIRYLHKSSFGKQKFDLAMNQVKLNGMKQVPMDVPTRWNSTYLMLEAAVDLKNAFVRLGEIDKNYLHNPSEEEWKVAKVICECLKIFYEATCHFSGTNFPTANVFFPDICLIQLQLMEWKNSEHEFLRKMAKPMKQKFEKYWEECSLVLAIGVILDPRYKLAIVEYYYELIYGTDAFMYIQRVRDTFLNLFSEYKSDSSDSTRSVVSEGDSSTSSHLLTGSSKQVSLAGFHKWYSQAHASSFYANQKTEVEIYLEEAVFPIQDNFNILHWWKVNSAKFPTLAKVARDILAVPATTVASEAAFSIGGRVIDENRACLLPEIVEALVTTNDWIESHKKRHVDECEDEE